MHISAGSLPHWISLYYTYLLIPASGYYNYNNNILHITIPCVHDNREHFIL